MKISPILIERVDIECGGCGNYNVFIAVDWRCPECGECYHWLSDSYGEDETDEIDVNRIYGTIVCKNCETVMIIDKSKIIAYFRKKGFKTKLEIASPLPLEHPVDKRNHFTHT